MRIKLNKPQYNVYCEKQKHVLFSGGYGSGKSFLGCLKVIRSCIKYPGIVCIIARQTMKSLKRTTYRTFKEILGMQFDIVGKMNKTDYYYTFNNDSLIYFTDLEDVSKLKSLELGFAFIDEANEIKEDIFIALQGRMRQKGDYPRQILLATNPDSPAHWIYKKFYLEKAGDENYKVIDSTPYDNKDNLPEDYISIIESYTGVYYDRYVLGKWVQAEGLVYSNFEPSIHLCNNIDFEDYQHWSFFYAIDWGYTNPAVCLYIGIDRDNTIYVFDEIYKSGLLNKEFAELIKSKHEDKHFIAGYADPSGATAIAEIRNYGINIIPASNDVINGIQSVLQLFSSRDAEGKAKIKISRKCSNLINELQSYAWEKQADGKEAKEKPIKFQDHAVDALRYLVYSNARIKQTNDPKIILSGKRE